MGKSIAASFANEELFVTCYRYFNLSKVSAGTMCVD